MKRKHGKQYMAWRWQQCWCWEMQRQQERKKAEQPRAIRSIRYINWMETARRAPKARQRHLCLKVRIQRPGRIRRRCMQCPVQNIIAPPIWIRSQSWESFRRDRLIAFRMLQSDNHWFCRICGREPVKDNGRGVSTRYAAGGSRGHGGQLSERGLLLL